MSGAADRDRLRAMLARVHGRRRMQAALDGAAAGLVAALLGLAALRLGGASAGPDAAAGWWAPALLALLGGAAGFAAMRARLRRGPGAAVLIESRAPGSRNAVITAAELLDRPGTVRPYVMDAVVAAAARAADGIDASRVLPVRPAAVRLVAAAGLWALALIALRGASRPAGAVAPGAAPDAGGIAAVEVVVTPPGYVGGEPARLRDPDRVVALEGSTLAVTVEANAQAVTLETVTGVLELARSPAGSGTPAAPTGTRSRSDAAGTIRFQGELSPGSDGFLAFEASAADGRVVARRFIGLTVTPDAPPRVSIVEPGTDTRLASGDHTIALEVEAEDDHALADVRVRYTRVTGFGERFTFLEGTVPLAVERAGPARWSGRANWSLAPLGLERGDMLVYRAEATDRRPGAEAGASDTYVVEIVGPEAATAAGATADEEMDRYALSQQMVIVLTERLLARRDSMSDDRFEEEALVIAAAQRTVRAGFVFMLGGELSDEGGAEPGIMELNEEAHARTDADAFGRLANEGRMELASAIQSMSQAVTLLGAVDLDDALRAERTALSYLERAFSRSRYILRALNERERLDLSRRLTGAAAGAVLDARPAPEPGPDDAVIALRGALADIATLAAIAEPDAAAGARAAELARDVARVDPGAERLAGVAAMLDDAAAAMAGEPGRARERLGAAALALAEVLRAALPDAAPPARPFGLDRLDGALSDALRAGGR